MNDTSYPSKHLRDRLSGEGIEANRHAAPALQRIVREALNAPPPQSHDANQLAELVLTLCRQGFLSRRLGATAPA